MKKFEGAGGTPGGVGEFIVGVMMAATGAYLVLDRVHVSSHFYLGWFGSRDNAFGALFSIFLLGVCIIFFNGKSWLGWGLCGAAALAILWGVVANLNIYFQPTNLIGTVAMFGLSAAGVGLMLKGIMEHDVGS